MSAHWGSSVLVEASLDAGVRLAPAKEGGFTRPHAFAEVISALTGGRLVFRSQSQDAARICRGIAKDLECVELDFQETLDVLDKARRFGVRGGHIHYFLHAIAARKAGADKIYTLNLGDFRSLRVRIEIALPAET